MRSMSSLVLWLIPSRQGVICNRIGIMACLAQHLAIGQAELRRGVLEQRNAFRREQRSAPTPTLGHCNGDPRPCLRRINSCLDLLVHALESQRIRMTKIDNEPHMLGDYTGQVGEAFDARRSGAPQFSRIGEADVIHGCDQVAGADQCVAPLQHRRAARMAGFAVDVDAQGEGLVAANHDADITTLAIEMRRLLDVQLQVAVEGVIAEWRPASIADTRELVAKADTGIVLRIVYLHHR